MKKKILKEYVYKDVSMLLAAKIVAFNFRDNISELSQLNSKWDEVYANDLIARIEDALNNHLGYDVKKELRDATSALNKIMLEVKTDIGVFKRLVYKFYRNEAEKKDEILNVLSLRQYPKANATKTQNGLIKLLFVFKTNLTDVLRQELVSKGIFENLIDKIIANANKLESINNIQEVLKGTTIEKSNSRKALYNSIFREVSSICIVAYAHFRPLKVKQDMFNFSRIVGVSTYNNSKTELENNVAAEVDNIIDDANNIADDVSTLD